MKNFFKGLGACFSMYSALPMPKIPWEGGALKYAFYFLPLVGLAPAFLEFFWYKAAVYLSMNCVFYAALAAVIPAIVTGGIHLDGYIDAWDAAATHGDHNKKAEVLKDPRAGAFGIIAAIVYFFLLLGIFSEFYIREGDPLLLVISFVLSRALGVLASVSIKTSRPGGLLWTFTREANKTALRIVMFLYILASLTAAAVFISPLFAVLFGGAAAVYYWWFRCWCLKSFGGISGDLAGFCISVGELLFIGFSVFGGTFK